ncbi:hypothetical protein TraAM80_09421 [Trypanosoma rangeli]|uniref:Uncharacterized protein n=1 Tax=Trypanosoma rangeli TaxID=5698 RepID=A0A422MVH8_TRYRA|nr:uncharacterized protein TraAM80_09421 [Trypanosoma rangeli]RNE97242.1 hypothetical protein TraAM80_09421 [Trypanosoma rangeli]|eukprot:RNE97242.1 hypothetical protein TraAM80_09421 [Trypanosoma rangeli]
MLKPYLPQGGGSESPQEEASFMSFSRPLTPENKSVTVAADATPSVDSSLPARRRQLWLSREGLHQEGFLLYGRATCTVGSAADLDGRPQGGVNRGVKQKRAASASPTLNHLSAPHNTYGAAVAHAAHAHTGGGYNGARARGVGPPPPLAERYFTPNVFGMEHFTRGSDAVPFGSGVETTLTMAA